LVGAGDTAILTAYAPYRAALAKLSEVTAAETLPDSDAPVQIVGEFQLWRRIRDADGAEGWVHSSTLAGRRTTIIRPPANTQETTLRRRAEEGGAAVARLRPGVIARVRECEAGNPWCEVQVSGHRGYLRRAEMWGVGPEEEVK
jgi:SH3-like domain-containing protein